MGAKGTSLLLCKILDFGMSSIQTDERKYYYHCVWGCHARCN